MNTLLLDAKTWDLTVDLKRNIALAPEPYAQAQDAASACRLFQGELWYDTSKGLPYWLQILGRRPPLSLVKAKLVFAAKTVPGVVSAQVFITSFVNRVLKGQVQIKNSGGQTSTVAL